MSSSISSLQQYQISSMTSQYETLFGSSTSDPISQSIEQAISPSTLNSAAEQAMQTNNTNDQVATEQASALAQFSSDANSLYQYASQLQTNTDASNANVTLSTDSPINSDSITNFVNAYNNMISFTNQNQQYIDSSVMNNLSSSYSNVASELQSVGITQNSDGTLSIDQDTLNDALQNNSSTVQSAFSGFDGIAVTTGNDAQDITQSSLSNYATQVSNTSSSSSSSELYNNFAELQQDNEWLSMINSFA
jgi:flagellar hook-associated protein 2